MSGAASTEDSLWLQQVAVAKAGALYLALYVVSVCALYSTADIVFPENDGIYFATFLISLGLGYVLLAVLMRRSASTGEDLPGGIGPYLWLSLLSGTAITMGLILPVLPGFYLMLRWMPAYARLYATRSNVTDALGWSWRSTKPIQKALALAMLGPLLLYVLLFVVAVGYEMRESVEVMSTTMSDLSVIGANLLTSAAAAWFTLLGVATYRMIEREPEELIETFA